MWAWIWYGILWVRLLALVGLKYSVVVVIANLIGDAVNGREEKQSAPVIQLGI